MHVNVGQYKILLDIYNVFLPIIFINPEFHLRIDSEFSENNTNYSYLIIDIYCSLL